LSNERIIENYKGCQIIANFFRNEYQARVQVPGEGRREVRKCNSVKDALEKARAIVDEMAVFSGLKKITGSFDLGYSADKHTIRSIPTGINESGHTTFDTTRSEMGEALFQLKYRSDFSKVTVIAHHLAKIICNKMGDARVIVPVPPSKPRSRQPVIEIARAVSKITGIPTNEDLLTKCMDAPQMKDISTQEEKVKMLESTLKISAPNASIQGPILLIDDLFDTGSSLNSCTNIIRTSIPNERIYALTVTRKHQ